MPLPPETAPPQLSLPPVLTLPSILILAAVTVTVAATTIAGATPPLPAMAATVACGATLHGGALIRLAWRMHRRPAAFGPCRGVGFLGLGTALSAVAAIGTAAVATTHTAVAVGVAGTTAVTLADLLGLMLLPGTAPTVRARLRRALDGAGIGGCLFYAAWLLIISERGGLTPAPFTVALISCVALAVAVVTGLRAVRYRRAALACAGGACLAILGSAGVVLTLACGASPGWLAPAAAAQIAGPILIAAGAGRSGQVPSAPSPGATTPADTDGTFASYPLLAAPIAIALTAATVHLVRHGSFDDTSIALAIAGILVLAARETLATLDVRRYAARLARREAHFRSLVAESTDVTMVLDADLVVRWQSPAAARQFGLAESDVLGEAFAGLLHPLDADRAVAQLRDVLAADRAEPRADPRAGSGPEPGLEPRTGRRAAPLLLAARIRDGFGRWRDTESTVSDQRAIPAVGALVLHVRDVQDRRELERSLHRMSWQDQLTGLANRRKLCHAADELRAAAGCGGAVLVITLEGLADVAGLHGQQASDAALIEAARRLRADVGERDLPVRLVGDEFAVLTDSPSVPAYALATHLVSVLGEPYPMPGFTVRLSASIGIANLSDGTGCDDALRRAELARRQGSQLGRGRVECYDESIEAAMLRRMTIEQQLPGAIQRGELDLVYQPVLELRYQQPVGVEALLRWRHPTLGVVHPGDLVPVAESLEIADELAGWVLHRACRQLSAWRRERWDLWISVNVSTRQLCGQPLLTAVTGALGRHGVPADRLVVELAEHGLRDPGPGQDTDRVAHQLRALRAMGVRTAIDRFGTGQSALANLRRLPFDLIKADPSLFTESAVGRRTTTPILAAVVEMGRRLGAEVIATGLEEAGHAELVRAAGCRFAQGYLLAAPAHAERVEAFLEAQHAPRL